MILLKKKKNDIYGREIKKRNINIKKQLKMSLKRRKNAQTIQKKDMMRKIRKIFVIIVILILMSV